MGSAVGLVVACAAAGDTAAPARRVNSARAAPGCAVLDPTEAGRRIGAATTPVPRAVGAAWRRESPAATSVGSPRAGAQHAVGPIYQLINASMSADPGRHHPRRSAQ